MNELSKQRCPHCNAVYEVGLSVCPECGLETQNPQVVSPQVDSSEPVENLHDSEHDQLVSRSVCPLYTLDKMQRAHATV